MVGVMLGPGKKPQQDGLQLSLYLSHIGKYAWRAGCQQALTDLFLMNLCLGNWLKMFLLNFLYVGNCHFILFSVVVDLVLGCVVLTFNAPLKL